MGSWSSTEPTIDGEWANLAHTGTEENVYIQTSTYVWHGVKVWTAKVHGENKVAVKMTAYVHGKSDVGTYTIGASCDISEDGGTTWTRSDNATWSVQGSSPHSITRYYIISNVDKTLTYKVRNYQQSDTLTELVLPRLCNCYPKVSGSYKDGNVFVKISGEYKEGTPYEKVSGNWKEGI